jgi:hypothetical protein
MSLKVIDNRPQSSSITCPDCLLLARVGAFFYHDHEVTRAYHLASSPTGGQGFGCDRLLISVRTDDNFRLAISTFLTNDIEKDLQRTSLPN